MVYGYVRVSSVDQNEARQIDAMDSAGVPRNNLFVDKFSGRDFNRPAWKRLRRAIKHGDLLVVQSIDRLGRDYDDILEEWRYLIKKKEADIRVLDMPLLDTTNSSLGLIGRFVGDIVLQILSFVAETERRNIHERQRQGIAAAKSRGVRFGRPKIALPEDFDQYAKLVREHKLTVSRAASCCGMSKSTFWRSLKSHGGVAI